MKLSIVLVLTLAAATFGADPPPSPPVVARVGNVAITWDQLQRPLIDGYGLNILLNLVQLELAKETAKQNGVAVSPQEIQAEHDTTIEKMFKDSNAKLQDDLDKAVANKDTAKADQIRAQIKHDNEQAFEQFLSNQHVARPEFDIVIETNAYLRKIATPLVAGKITDDTLKEAFAAMYGETVQCRHIQCSTLQDIQEAKRRVTAGEDFAKVARELSINKRTSASGGELLPFSRQYADLPQSFRDAAFALKEGEVSEIVHTGDAFHIIKLDKRIPPKAVQFEDVKESLRANVQDLAVQQAVKQLRQQIAAQAVKNLQIEDPVLRDQFQKKLEKEKGPAATQPIPVLP
jgi:parvulin-like peptidyl-prolyl isomerase